MRLAELQNPEPISWDQHSDCPLGSLNKVCATHFDGRDRQLFSRKPTQPAGFVAVLLQSNFTQLLSSAVIQCTLDGHRCAVLVIPMKPRCPTCNRRMSAVSDTAFVCEACRELVQFFDVQPIDDSLPWWDKYVEQPAEQQKGERIPTA